jgi:hypothetical protein
MQNLLSSSSLPYNVNIKTGVTIILPVVLYDDETWSVILREKRRLRVLENRVLRRIFRPKRDKLTGGVENYIMRSLTFRNPASYIKDGHTATFNTPHFLYFFNKHTY